VGAIVTLRNEDEYADDIMQLDAKVRAYTKAPLMTPYVKGASHYLPYLAHMGEEHLRIMPDRRLPRRLKELVATAVSMVNNCDYCIRAHAHIAKNHYGMNDAELVEMTGAVAHVSGLNRFETATMSDPDDPLFAPVSPDDEPLLRKIEQELGELPTFYAIMANDPTYLQVVWEREEAVMLTGALDRTDKLFLALGASVANDAPYAVRFYKRRLEARGMEPLDVFEALEVIEVFQKNNVFTQGLRLESTLFAD
jgi:AhpD family alkylhydroperoxidase